VALARRDVPGRDGKAFVSQNDLASTVTRLLADIHDSMLKRAIAYRDANIHDPRTYDEFKEAVSGGWAFSWWCGDRECEARIKEDTRATARCIPLDTQPGGTGTCIVCGREADKKVLFGRAY
jgi:prolyl-tRNA synthetase